MEVTFICLQQTTLHNKKEIEIKRICFLNIIWKRFIWDIFGISNMIVSYVYLHKNNDSIVTDNVSIMLTQAIPRQSVLNSNKLYNLYKNVSYPSISLSPLTLQEHDKTTKTNYHWRLSKLALYLTIFCLAVSANLQSFIGLLLG